METTRAVSARPSDKNIGRTRAEPPAHRAAAAAHETIVRVRAIRLGRCRALHIAHHLQHHRARKEWDHPGGAVVSLAGNDDALVFAIALVARFRHGHGLHDCGRLAEPRGTRSRTRAKLALGRAGAQTTDMHARI